MAETLVRARRAFTLVELLFVIAIIFLIMGLLLGGIRHVMKHVKGTVDLNMASALKNGASQFGQTFSFAPPLIKDGFAPTFNVGPLNAPTNATAPVVYSRGYANELHFLRFGDTTSAVSPAPGTVDLRFSLYSIPYYLMGVLDQPRGGVAGAPPIDGFSGPGFRAVRRDGTFEPSGRTFSPFFDVKGHAEAVVENTPPGAGRIELRDGHGVAVRYYRWVTGRIYGASTEYQVRVAADCNVPWMVGDAAANPDLRNADYAIVLAGPDGLFGDEFLLPQAPQHPQYMSRNDFDIKLGGKAPANGPPGDPDRMARAMAANIVVV